MVGTLSNTVFWLSENESSPTAKPAEPVPGEPPEAAAPHSSRAGTVAERGTKESAGIGVVAAQRVAAAAAQRLLARRARAGGNRASLTPAQPAAPFLPVRGIISEI